MLNHVPTVGFGISVCLLVISLVYTDDRLQRVSFGLMFLIALVTLPVYLTGVAAGEMIQDRPEVSGALIRAHEDAALSAFVLMQISGGAAWLALWQFRRFARPPRGMVLSVLLFSLVSIGLMAYAANLGGSIRHPEILSVEPAAVAGTPLAAAWLRTQWVIAIVNDTSWVWPASEAVHFVGLGLSFGVVLLLNLRVLGLMKSLAYTDVHRMLPWGMVGFAMNLATGMMFFISVPAQYTTNPSFQLKMILLVLLGANLLYFTSCDDAWRVGRGEDAPRTAKAFAAFTIVLWVGVVYFGRMLPFLGNAY
jgi:uncharacterized membrane protein